MKFFSWYLKELELKNNSFQASHNQSHLSRKNDHEGLSFYAVKMPAEQAIFTQRKARRRNSRSEKTDRKLQTGGKEQSSFIMTGTISGATAAIQPQENQQQQSQFNSWNKMGKAF